MFPTDVKMIGLVGTMTFKFHYWNLNNLRPKISNIMQQAGILFQLLLQDLQRGITQLSYILIQNWFIPLFKMAIQVFNRVWPNAAVPKNK